MRLFGVLRKINPFLIYSLDKLRGPDGELPQKLQNLSLKHIKRLSNEIMERDLNVCWDDIGISNILYLL